MAVVTSVNSGRGMLAAVAVLLIMAVGAKAARPMLNLPDGTSCDTADKYVYSFRSYCWDPAKLSAGYVYSTGFLRGALGPEYDESNSTYYVRLTEEGATYKAVGANAESGTLLVNSSVYIFNTESNRALKWRQEGVDEYFLIEEEVSSITDGAEFFFLLQVPDVVVPCPAIWPTPQCQAYYLVSFPGSTTSASATFTTASGLLAYPEEGATYVKAAASGSTGDLPLDLLTGSTTSSSSSILPFPTIRTVTDHGA